MDKLIEISTVLGICSIPTIIVLIYSRFHKCPKCGKREAQSGYMGGSKYYKVYCRSCKQFSWKGHWGIPDEK